MQATIRIMEERAVLTQKMADDAYLTGRGAAAASYEQRTEESRAYAETLRRAINQY